MRSSHTSHIKKSNIQIYCIWYWLCGFNQEHFSKWVTCRLVISVEQKLNQNLFSLKAIFMVINGQTCEHEVKQPINIHSTFCWRILTYLSRCFTGIWYLVLFDKSDARVGWLGDIYFVLTHGEHWAITTLDLPQTWSAPRFHRGVVTQAICLISSH